tara:strand:+ start:3007 stop:4350 length:1344 start_codon:yes stop_codon:yes gene_type:complete
MFNADAKLMEKWNPVLEHTDLENIQDSHKKAVTARLLENQEIAAREEKAAVQGTFLGEDAAANATGSNIDNFNPVLISLVRRAMPNLIAYDIAGVQPMSGPTGLIFAMKSKYSTQGGTEALFDEANTAFSGDSSVTQEVGPSGLESAVDDGDNNLGTGETAGEIVSDFGGGLSTAAAEALGTGGSGGSFGEMAFSIDKVTVTAKSRALKAEYTMELAQDLKAIHGLDAEAELANILSAEILAEINREIVRTVNRTAKLGAGQASVATKGIFNMNTDSDGRWLAERAKGLIMQIEREANVIAKQTRRGKGNYIICSSDVASVLAASGMLDYSPALSTNLNVDDTGNTFAGVLNGRFKVYVDPYAGGTNPDYVTVGFRGANPYDAGVFYCPYVPLTMVKAIGEEDFQPRIGFKTRYGMVANPFVATDGSVGSDRSNPYFRIFRVDGIMV